MKKILFAVSGLLLLSNSFRAQDDNFDKKFRFGLKVAGQPTWLKSGDNNTKGNGAGFGFGFGLITEFKLSDIVHFSTGIGGDFETGKIKYRNDYTATNPNNYYVGYVLDNNSSLVKTENGMQQSSLYSSGNTAFYPITERKIKTTYLTIPLSIKLLTNEYSGFRYFGMFGGELGFRLKAKAEDKYLYNINSGSSTVGGSGTNSNINIGSDATLIPMRVGMNLGIGTEYRIAGSTSLMLSVNYFHSFTNLMRNESKYAVTNSSYNPTDGTMSFTHLKQNLLANAIRINVGIMF